VARSSVLGRQKAPLVKLWFCLHFLRWWRRQGKLSLVLVGHGAWRSGAIDVEVWQNFEGRRPLFMEILALDSSWGKFLTILSLTELDPALVREKSRRGWIPFGYEFFPNSVSGVDLRSVALGRDASEAAGPGLGRAKMEKGRGKERLAGPSSAFSWVSAHYQIGIRKIIFFFKSFYNLQTNLNSIQIQILTTSTRTIKYKNTSQHKEKYASTWNATNKCLFKYMNL
jgi:hypothetical protein